VWETSAAIRFRSRFARVRDFSRSEIFVLNSSCSFFYFWMVIVFLLISSFP
jgi:hypothetical protein